MSDDSIKMSFVADDKEMLAAYRRMQKEVEALKKANAGLGKEVSKSSEEIASGFQKASSHASGVALGLVSTNTLMSVTQRIAGDWASEMEKVKQLYKDVNKEVAKSVSSGPDFKFGAQIEKFLENMKGATKDQGRQAYAGITSASPSLTLDQRLNLTEQVARQAPTGIDLNQFGNMAGKIQEMIPTRAADDVADITAFLQAAGGEDFSKFGGDKFLNSVAKLQAAGMKPERALGIGLAAAENNLPAGFAGDYAEALIEKDPNADRRPTTKLDHLMRDFYKQDWQGRQKLLQTNKDIAAQRFGTGGMVNAQAMGDGTSQQLKIIQAQSANYAQQRLDALQGYKAGAQALSQQSHAVTVQPFELSHADAMAQAQRAREFVYEKTGQKSTWLSRYTTAAAMGTAEFGASVVGTNRTSAVIGAATGGVLTSDEQANTRGMISGKQREEFWQREKEMADRQAKATEENNRLLQKNNSLMESQNKQPARKDININRHVE